VAVAMLAALALTAGGAWLLVYVNEGPARLGAEIVSQIQSEGLSEFWSQTREEYWRVNGEDWWYFLRFELEDGGFAGVRIRRQTGARQVVSPNGTQVIPTGYWEIWTLNRDATEGDYQAGSFGPGRIYRDTRIQYSDGKVQASQFEDTPGKRTKTEGAAPNNYVPEGALELARSLVARKDSPAAFQWILKDRRPFGSTPDFLSVRYEPGQSVQGPDGTELREVITRHEMRQQQGVLVTMEKTFYINPEGNEVRVSEKIIAQDQILASEDRRLVPPEEARESQMPKRLKALAREILGRAGIDSPAMQKVFLADSPEGTNI
jgi:hypothetical protein